jgi:hypothetical protein
LPYLEANLEAVANHKPRVRFESFGGHFEIPTSTYRAACWQDLCRKFAALSTTQQKTASGRLGFEIKQGNKALDLNAPTKGQRIANRHWK